MGVLKGYPGVARELTNLFLRRCTSPAARRLIQARLEARDRLFLTTVQRTIWDYPASPYRRLLTAAGWTPQRLTNEVRQRGLEPTLGALRDSGVYLTHDEFKGRRPIQRDGVLLRCAEEDFDNPTVAAAFEMRTGGTRSAGSRVKGSFVYLAEQRAPTWRLSLDALGASSGPVIIWMPSVTHGGGLMWWLALAHMGRPAYRWFSITDPSAPAVPSRHRFLFRFGQVVGLSRGLRVPYPQHADLNDPHRVLTATLAARARYGGCAVTTSPSGATRLAAAAAERGVDLEQVTFVIGGEPLTDGKYREIVASGATVGARYATTEAGALGGTCGRPASNDDVHFMADSFGLVLNPATLPDGQTVQAFAFTTLLPSTSKVLLNVESDDFGQVAERRCGCLWDDLGLHTHLSSIRSFSKLTGEGATVLGTDCLRVLDDVLPREFGGRSFDYQLLEAEDERHFTRLYLVVSPSVGPIDEARLRERFMAELRDGRQPRNLTPPVWRLAGTIRVIRREPIRTAGGKLLPFHTLALLPREESRSVLGRSGA